MLPIPIIDCLLIISLAATICNHQGPCKVYGAAKLEGPTQTLLPPSPLTLLNSTITQTQNLSVEFLSSWTPTREGGNLTSDINSRSTALNNHHTCIQPCTKRWKRVNGEGVLLVFFFQEVTFAELSTRGM